VNAYGEDVGRGPRGPNPFLERAGAAFWRDESERWTYERAVAENPRGPKEGPFAYIERIAGVVAGVRPVKSMPATPREPGCDDDVEVPF
jgi:hypothetical protein